MNQEILQTKTELVNEVVASIKDSSTVVICEYRGLTVAEVTELRKQLRENDSDCKVYKNTLVARALEGSDYNLNEFLEGPSAISFSNDELAPVRVLSEFAKKHNALELKVGIVEGKVANKEELNTYAAIPSRDTLLTILASGMIGVVRDLSICLDLYAQQKEEQ